MTQFLEGGKLYRLVLTETQLTGFVSWGDLFRPEMNVCILALLLGVESRCVEALTWEPNDAENALARLAPGRLQKARDVYARALPKGADPNMPMEAEELVCSTTFADKAAMVGPLEQFGGISRRQLEKDFARMERTRNGLAHTRMGRSEGLRDLSEVIRIAEDILRRLSPLDEPRGLRLVVSNKRIVE